MAGVWPSTDDILPALARPRRCSCSPRRSPLAAGKGAATGAKRPATARTGLGAARELGQAQPLREARPRPPGQARMARAQRRQLIRRLRKQLRRDRSQRLPAAALLGGDDRRPADRRAGPLGHGRRLEVRGNGRQEALPGQLLLPLRRMLLEVLLLQVPRRPDGKYPRARLRSRSSAGARSRFPPASTSPTSSSPT